MFSIVFNQDTEMALVLYLMIIGLLLGVCIICWIFFKIYDKLVELK